MNQTYILNIGDIKGTGCSKLTLVAAAISGFARSNIQDIRADCQAVSKHVIHDADSSAILDG